MTIKLDPKEVRAHLHRLGYCNITGEQLKDFIKGKLPILYGGKKDLAFCNHTNKLDHC
jgi:hypothetical protein